MIRQLGILMVALTTASGCCGWRASRRDCCPQAAVLAPPAKVEMATLAAPNGDIELGPLPTDQSVAGRPAPPAPGPWWPLTPDECQCLAAEQSSLANMMDQERRFLCTAEGDESCSFTAMQKLQQQLLLRQSEQERNNAAERALLAYYGLVEVKLQRRILDQTEREIQSLNEAIELVQAAEVTLELDVTEGLRRMSEALSQRSDLAAVENQMNHQLRSLLGVRKDQPGDIWPTCRLLPDEVLSDLQIAESRTVHCRADLDSVRLVRRQLNTETLAAARGVLSALQAGLGADVKSALSCTPSCLTQWAHRDDCDDQRELAARCAQLAELEEYLEGLVREQVRKHHFRHRNAVRRLVLAQQKVEAWKTRQLQLAAQQEAGSADGALKTQAKLMQFAAESEVLHEVIAVEMIKVQWRAAQGLLAAECGYGHCALAKPTPLASPAAEPSAAPTADLESPLTASFNRDVPRRSAAEYPALDLPAPPEFTEFLRR